ncbi:hypothetical protein B0H13DRAFT_1971689 [Mycena leptocephala]|nr:hypothetical protein B0H13DRAFT_1971689 [Mycena leptocephala]
MQFSHSILALVIIASTTVHAAPGAGTSLTKRWCGYEPTCKCDFDPETGCVPQFDECAKQWFWPIECTGCGSCPELCVDFHCPPPN